MYRLGIDLGGTNIAAGVVNEKFDIVCKASVKTNASRSADEISGSIAELCGKVTAEAGLKMSDIWAFGIGSPGSVDSEHGVVLSAGNLGFNNVELCKLLKQRTGREFYIANDANAAAYGEYIAGAGKGCRDLVVITLGTGVGSGVIIDGKIYSGGKFSGGEIGHIVIDFNGEPCVCGLRGCFENYASATALINQTKSAMLDNKNSIMWQICSDISGVDGTVAFKAARMGDFAAQTVVDKYIEYVSVGIINTIRIFEPEKICIGGGISNEKDNLILPIKDYIRRCDKTGLLLKNTDICVATLKNDAGIIGAAYLDTLYRGKCYEN